LAGSSKAAHTDAWSASMTISCLNFMLAAASSYLAQ
jgi:hypothetical protein